MSYTLHPDAEAELAEAAGHYAAQASPKIAGAFLTEFERIISLAMVYQELGAPAREGLRILPFQRFPYSVVYRKSEAGPIIYAVAHHRRKPDYWQDRI